MSAPSHTFGPTCVLCRPQDPDSDNSRPPKANAQFFYVSALPIDDPLSPLPPVASDSASAQSKYPPQPFSARDNAALEEAWIGYQKDETPSSRNPRNHRGSSPRQLFRTGKSEKLEAHSAPSASVSRQPLVKDFGRMVQSSKDSENAVGPFPKPDQPRVSTQSTSRIGVGDSASDGQLQGEAERTEAKLEIRQSRRPSALSNIPERSTLLEDQSSVDHDSTLCSQAEELLIHNSEARQGSNSPGSRRDSSVLLDDTGSGAESHMRSLDRQQLTNSSSAPQERGHFGRRARSPLREFLSRSRERVRNSSPHSHGYETPTEIHDDPLLLAPSPADLNTSGRPFARVPSQHFRPQDAFSARQDDRAGRSRADSEPPRHLLSEEDHHEETKRGSYKASSFRSRNSNRGNSQRDFVPVGVSRLHLVELPDLLMKPIYWNPINDVSNVLRSTWFYKNTMAPVDPDLANQLEIGYEYMQPWTDTWQDELNSIIDIGADAELKVVHRLWPEDENRQAGGGVEIKGSSTIDLLDDQPRPLSKPKYLENLSAGPKAKYSKTTRLFKSHSVIYVNATDAQILRPSLLPSPSRGRRPLNAIRKSRQIGVAVVRGFEREAWEKIHPPKKMSARTAQAQVGAYLSQSGDAATQGRRTVCPACHLEERRPKVTDLVLVVHGIGQKLSERVDSFHFTHAINDFRRQVNIELSNDAVQGKLRPEMGGIMVLPINWRLTLSLDEEEFKAPSGLGGASNEYHLKDITPETLPAVRNLISDVMLDIPYYLSNHKQKMISAVVTEANRVYRLWCRNNPRFHETGRVHLIAHSLGSAMVMDVLSQQPTKLPQNINPKGRYVEDHFFEFDTKSLFCCGSPAGFFLLLNRANLIPRQGRNKPGAGGDDLGRGVGGEAGTYGCLAVDNIYNVMHYNDPIAYHVNATVDTDYASSLKPARIPYASPGFFAGLGSSFKWSDASVNGIEADTLGGASATRPNINKLPSTIEMDTHDFSREEIAEKRMFLLNDNGQIDYFLNSGGGPLEIQYLSMLSAHSSYWTLQDFIRFVVLEVGRRPGRSGTLPFLRAEKKRIYKAGKIP
ncbi:MAG: hypothetical protein Q9160_000697 [Pyrenula sp. 1 TL-2023]